VSALKPLANSPLISNLELRKLYLPPLIQAFDNSPNNGYCFFAWQHSCDQRYSLHEFLSLCSAFLIDVILFQKLRSKLNYETASSPARLKPFVSR
jgi:hypothetical protein